MIRTRLEKVVLLESHLLCLSLFLLHLLVEEETGLLFSLPLLLARNLLLLVAQDEEALADSNRLFNVPLVVVAGLHNDGSDVVDLGQQLQARDKAHQFSVVGVVIPTKDWKSVFRLELVGVRRVVDDDDVLHATTHPRHILDEESVEKSAMFTEQPLGCDSARVQDVHQGDSILGETRSEDDYFVILAHLLDEFATARSHLDVDLASTPLNIDWKDDVRLFSRRERGMDQGIVNVKDQGFAAVEEFLLRFQKVAPSLGSKGMFITGRQVELTFLI